MADTSPIFDLEPHIETLDPGKLNHLSISLRSYKEPDLLPKKKGARLILTILVDPPRGSPVPAHSVATTVSGHISGPSTLATTVNFYPRRAVTVGHDGSAFNSGRSAFASQAVGMLDTTSRIQVQLSGMGVSGHISGRSALATPTASNAKQTSQDQRIGLGISVASAEQSHYAAPIASNAKPTHSGRSASSGYGKTSNQSTLPTGSDDRFCPNPSAAVAALSVFNPNKGKGLEDQAPALQQTRDPKHVQVNAESVTPSFAPNSGATVAPTTPIDIPKQKMRLKAGAGTTQANLDFGQNSYTRCEECEMWYNKANSGDRKSHAKYHADTMGDKAAKTITNGFIIYEKHSDRKGNIEMHRVYATNRQSSSQEKLESEKALEAYYKEEGGSKISREKLWSQIENPQNYYDPNLVPRYKLFIYRIGLELVGVLLAERVADASAYIDNEAKSIGTAFQVQMSIERIWVKKEWRGQGLGTKLVDLARDHFIQGLVLSKKDIAFSQPTQAGASFARKYVGGGLRGDAWFFVTR